MSTTVEIDLFDLGNLKNGLEWLYNNLDNQVEEMMKEIAKDGENYLESKYNDVRFKDPNITELFADSKFAKDSCEIIGKGKDVVYEEFGTGDKGEDNPHPVKSKYALNDYNSGVTIQDTHDNSNPRLVEYLAEHGIHSGKYWRYKKNGETYFTQGVPAGQEMWDTRNYLINSAIPNIVEKRRKIINENFVKSIKR